MAFCIDKQPMITDCQSIDTVGVKGQLSSKKALEFGPSSVDNRPPRIRKFSYEELTPKLKDENVLGRGAYGKVYKVLLEKTNETVAVKKLDPDAQQGHKDLLSGGVDLTQLNHPNLIKVFDVVEEKQDEMLLVYEFMTFGSLADHLFGPKPDRSLDWNTKMKIASGVAKGLEYLHSKNIVHCDVKSSNIFLDSGYRPMLSDFGTSRKGYKHGTELLNMTGIVGYCAPEYVAAAAFSFRSDVFSLGVILLELITGRRAFDQEIGEGFFDYRGIFDEKIDPVLKSSYPPGCYERAMSLARHCIKGNPNKRPGLAHVLNVLPSLSAY